METYKIKAPQVAGTLQGVDGTTITVSVKAGDIISGEIQNIPSKKTGLTEKKVAFKIQNPVYNSSLPTWVHLNKNPEMQIYIPFENVEPAPSASESGVTVTNGQETYVSKSMGGFFTTTTIFIGLGLVTAIILGIVGYKKGWFKAKK